MNGFERQAMNTVLSPLDRILGWLDNLSGMQRHDVAVIVGSRFPGISLDPRQGEMDAQFVSQLHTLLVSPLKEWGIVVCFRDLLELFVIGKRSSREQWREARSILEELALTTGDESYARRARETEFYGVQWVKSCGKWDEMVRPYVSDGYLENYFRPLLPPASLLPNA